MRRISRLSMNASTGTTSLILLSSMEPGLLDCILVKTPSVSLSAQHPFVLPPRLPLRISPFRSPLFSSFPFMAATVPVPPPYLILSRHTALHIIRRSTPKSPTTSWSFRATPDQV